MSAASSVCSDDSFEIVDHELDTETPNNDASTYKPKVTFHEVFDVYPMDADVVARISFDNDLLKSDEDTVVVLPIAWKSVDQALCAAKIDGDHVRFDVKELPKVGAEDKFYQLCYCTADKNVMGVSIPFSFREVHEDELVEFQKEQNREFWTFRSRFAVLMDIYWNSLLETKPVEAIEKPVDDQPDEKTLDDDDDGEIAGTSKLPLDAENDHKILLFQIMKGEYEELQREFEEQQKKYEELQTKYDEKKKIYDENKEFMLNSHLKKVLDGCKAEPGRTELDILFTFDLANGDFKNFKESPRVASQNEGNQLALDETNKSTESISIEKSEQNNNLTNSNAAFIATSSGAILVAEKQDNYIQRTKPFIVPIETETENSVPEDWLNEKMKLWEKCEELEAEVVLHKTKVQELQETLINQRQCEVEKVITVTDNMRERYIKDVNKFKDQNATLKGELKRKDEELENLNKNILEMSKLLTENEEEIKNLKARDHSVVGFLERRNLKRISELEDRLHDLYSKMWVERKETIQLREDLLTSQALYNSLRDEKDKPNKENSTTENSVQTSSDIKSETNTTENSAYAKRRAAAHEYFYRVLQHHATSNYQDMSATPSCSFLEHRIQFLLDQPVPRHLGERCEVNLLKPLEVQTPSEKMNAELTKAKEKEAALAAKLVEVTAELEKMKELYAKTKTDLEARLKDGAKQYAKLYMKYMKRLESSTPKSSS